MDIQVAAESAISTPAAGYRTLFINTDKGNRLYYKLSDGSFEPFTGSAGENMEDIAQAWMAAIKCALDKGMINAQQFQDIINTGLVVSESAVTDDDGNTTTTITVGARNIALVDITLGSSTFTGAAAATQQIVVTFNPTNTSDKSLTYVSNNPSKATVSATGLITAVATGSAVISVIPTADPSKTKTVTVTVT